MITRIIFQVNNAFHKALLALDGIRKRGALHPYLHCITIRAAYQYKIVRKVIKIVREICKKY